MAGLSKRTKLKSSPEEAEFYRRFHDAGVAALRQGTSRDALLKELQDQGVSLLSAERLVTAFEQEASLFTQKDHLRGQSFIGSFLLIGIFGLSFACYVMWDLGRNEGSRWGYAAWAAVAIVAAIIRAVRRSDHA